MEQIDQLEVVLAETRVEATKFFEKNNKAAGTRLRAKLQEVTMLCKSLRVEVQALKNAE